MPLSRYWDIIWKRAWIPILLVGVVAAASLLTTQQGPTLYTSTMRFTVGVKPQEIEGQFNYDSYYAWVASEYLADDMTVIVNSQAFANDVNQVLADRSSAIRIPPGNITGVAVSGKQHRILSLTLTWPNPDELAEIGQAILQVMTEESPKYVAQLGTPGGLISVIDEPSAPTPIPPSLTERLRLPVRLGLALIAGLALVFLLEYLDNSVRSRADLESLGIKVLAEVPK